MKIYTSRFTNPLLNSGEYFTVGITLGKPKFPLKYVENYHSYFLAPRGYMWRIESDDEFNRAYRQMLDEQKDKVVEELRGICRRAEGKDVVLLCYEDVRDPSQCCHRTELAKWMTENLEIQVDELFDPTPCKMKKPKQPEMEQMSLF